MDSFSNGLVSIYVIPEWVFVLNDEDGSSPSALSVIDFALYNKCLIQRKKKKKKAGKYPYCDFMVVLSTVNVLDQ